MKILLISTSFPVNEDGSEAAGSFVKDFVTTLYEQGHDVAVVAPISGQKLYNQKDGIEFFWFQVLKLPLSLLSPKKPQDWWPIFKALHQGKKAVNQAVNKFQPDHIFALWALPSGHWARYAKKRYDIPYSIWALGSDIWTLGKIPVIKNYLRAVLRDANQQFADGYKLAEDVTKISGKPCEFLPSTRQLPVCGLPLTESIAPPYRLCFLGRWHHNKGVDLLLEALYLLDDNDWKNIKEIRIAGGGPMEVLVREKVAELQEKYRPVSLLGFQDKLGAAELLIWTDYVIIPSRIESIPVIFSDSMQAMRPVITMPVGDLPILLIKKNGLLAKNVSAVALLEEMKSCVSKSNVSFVDGIKRTKADFCLDEIVKKYISLI